jgi:hypothetical protein
MPRVELVYKSDGRSSVAAEYVGSYLVVLAPDAWSRISELHLSALHNYVTEDLDTCEELWHRFYKPSLVLVSIRADDFLTSFDGATITQHAGFSQTINTLTRVPDGGRIPNIVCIPFIARPSGAPVALRDVLFECAQPDQKFDSTADNWWWSLGFRKYYVRRLLERHSSKI